MVQYYLLQWRSIFETVVGDLLPLKLYHLQLHLMKYSTMIDPHQMGLLLLEIWLMLLQLSIEIISYVLFLCCSLFRYVMLLNTSIVWLITAQAGIDNDQIVLYACVMPPPLVRPPDVLRLLISICSMIRAVDSPAQYLSLLLITWYPS